MKTTKKNAIVVMAVFALILAGCDTTVNDASETTNTTETMDTTTSPASPPATDTSTETKTFTVTFNSNGGTAVESQIVEDEKNATKPTNPTKADDEDFTNYVFEGWYKDSSLTNAFDFDTTITTDITLYAKWSGTPVIYIGTKKPSVAKEVGDIVFNDGSSMPYADFSVLDDDAKNTKKMSAIALIFYKGTGLNSDSEDGTPNTTTIRTLGVGLKHSSRGLAWCTGDANAYEIGIDTILCVKVGDAGALDFYYDKNGSDNLEQISAFLSAPGSEMSDDTGNVAHYPAFYFAKNYKDEKINSEIASRITAGSEYASGWYLPSVAELFQIYACRADSTNGFDIDAASQALDGDMFESSIYRSSSQTGTVDNHHAYLLNFEQGEASYAWKYWDYYLVCAIREFN